MEVQETQALEKALVCTILIASAKIIQDQTNRKKKRKRSTWVRGFLQQRGRHGAHIVTVNALRENDLYYFRRYLRMSSDVYAEVIS